MNLIFSGFIKNFDLNEKIKTQATKTELKAEKYEVAKLQTYDLNIFVGQNYFSMMKYKVS